MFMTLLLWRNECLAVILVDMSYLALFSLFNLYHEPNKLIWYYLSISNQFQLYEAEHSIIDK